MVSNLVLWVDINKGGETKNEAWLKVYSIKARPIAISGLLRVVVDKI